MKFFTLLLFLVFINSYPQYHVVEYQNLAKLIPSYEQMKNGDSIDFKNSSNFALLKKKYERELMYELLISNNESIFKVKDTNSKDKIYELVSGNKWTYYKNLNTKENFRTKIKILE